MRLASLTLTAPRSHEQQHEHDNEDDAYNARWAVAPSSGVTPVWERADKQQDKNDKQDGAEHGYCLLCRDARALRWVNLGRMGMDYREATRSDLARVFRSNADRLLSEYAKAGYSPRQAKDLLTARINAGNAHALTQNNEAVAIIVWEIVGNVIMTSFAAKEEFFSSRTLRFCHKHIRTIQAQQGNLQLCSTSFSDHPRVGRWFEALGFVVGPSEQPATNYWLMPQ